MPVTAKGLEGIIANSTRLSEVIGDKGQLIYCGYDINEQAALKCVYMAIMSLDPTGKGQARWTSRWKTALNAFDITFDGRLSAARH